MPLTVKLSQRFYETLGDEAANELVTWLNTADAAYRSEFRELFEANFGRVESRLRELEARMEAKLEGLKSELLRWMFLFWVGTMGTVVALLKF